MKHSIEVDVSHPVAFLLIGHLYLSVFVVSRASKNGYQKSMHLKEIGLHSQNM